MPGDSGATVVTMLVWFYLILHARLRVHRAPGIPHALNSYGAENSCTARAHLRRGNAGVCLRTCHIFSCHHPRKRVIQYSRDVSDEIDKPRRTGYPLEPVIGLAEGETRWRGMTTLVDEAPTSAAAASLLALPLALPSAGLIDIDR